MELHKLAEQVTDRESFLAFARQLRDDRVNGNPDEWQNDTIEHFLDSAIAWAVDSDFGDRQDLRDASPWKRFAAFLYFGKIYE